MPQETNLNVSPYFDDFDKNKNFHRVLFKPGAPVQARELSTLQSILQNQVEQFGTHFFKEGSMVIPGNLNYNNHYTCVQIEDTFLGIPVSIYSSQLVGLKITGSRSGVTASVVNILPKEDSERGNLTLYIKYRESGNDLGSERFEDGESLFANKDIIYGASVIAANEPFANTLPVAAAATGSAMSIGEGVYFIRGNFVQVNNETLILNQYNDRPTFRIGLEVQEDFVTADEDESLNDNASGFTNFAAPGADRFRITVSLSKKTIKDTNDQNFIEISRVINGELQSFAEETQYNLINDALAQRTFDESGDYYIRPFEVFAKESLNDQIGNKGVYSTGQKTSQGNTPSESLLTFQVSPGTAYVKGYKIDRIASTFIDVAKPRKTRTIAQEAVTYRTGDPLFVNNIFGSPSLGIGTTATVALLDKRRGGSGAEIGLARLYDFKAQSGSFVDASTQFETRLFDVKTFTNVKVGTAITSVTLGTHIQGVRSGASGFVRSAGTNVTDLSLIDVNGIFLKDESILINGVQNGRVLTKVDRFTFNDVKSLKSAVGVSTFEADLLLNNSVRLSNLAAGNFRLSNTSGNAGIITASGQNFAGIITSNNIISYTVPGETLPRFNRITGVSTNGDAINVVGVASVSNICNGGVSDGLIPGSIDVNDLVLRSPSFRVGSNSLVTPVSHGNINTLDVTNTTILLRKQFSDITVANNQFTSPDAGTNLFFQPFDEERYFISYDDGSVEPLKSSQVDIAADKKTVTFVGLSKATGKANLFATVLKSKVVNKQKKLQNSNVLIVSGSSLASSGIGTNTLNDGLTTSNVFGTRVQDSKISLNVPDACELVAVIESNDAGDPDLPTVTLTSYDGPNGDNSDLIIGEKINGLGSKAVGLVVEKPDTTTIGIVPLNQNTFNIGELIETERSLITARVTQTTDGDRNITNQFSLTPNIKPTYYDFSYIQRKKTFEAPTNRLKIVFKNFFVTSDDVGDFFTASSYPTNSQRLVPTDRSFGVPTSDLIDIRPRVAEYNTSSTISPFDFRSRTFASQENNIPDPFVPDENLIVSYDYFLPRKDKLFLTKNGEFAYTIGVSADDPKPPRSINDAIEVATISLPAFAKDVSKIKIVRTKHKRFRMSDIGRLEKRLEQVEYYTALSLLEQDTSNLQITDANGLTRFKSGFFVDNFKKHEAHQIGHPDFSASIDATNGYLRPGHYTTCLDLVVGSRSFIGIGQAANPSLDLNFVTDIDGTNVKKTGRLLTLDYTEETFVEQIYASRTENVQPYLIVFYQGNIKLSPDSDTWTDTKRLSANVINETGAYDAAISDLGIDVQTGFSEVDWGGWQTDFVGETVKDTFTESNQNNLGTLSIAEANSIATQQNLTNTIPQQGANFSGDDLVSDAAIITNTTFQDIEVGTHSSRQGVQYNVKPVVTSTSLGDKIVSRDIIPFMRSRNIEIVTSRMKPKTRFYAFFDNIDVTLFTTPKLLEVSMTSGVFTTGETVRSSDNTFVFRLASSNHKEGPYNSPTKTLTLNPYNPQSGIPASYSTSTTFLNVDTFSLATQVQGSFFGHVKKNMKLIGQSSGAEATVTDVRLVTDAIGTLTACFNIPDPNTDANPRFETGTKTVRLTTSSTNSVRGPDVTGAAETNFAAAGSVETQQETVLSTKVPQIERISTEEKRVINNRITRQVSTNQALSGVRNVVETRTEIEEVIREVEVEVVREVEVEVEVEKIVEREVEVEVERIVEVPAEPIIQFVDRPVIEFRDRVETRVEIQEVEVEKEVFIDRPVIEYRDRIVEREVFVDRPVVEFRDRVEIVERFIDRPVEVFVDRPVIQRVEVVPPHLRRFDLDQGSGEWVFIEDDDPLGQTFTVNDSSGVFITSVDCFFQTKDEELPVTLQIRTVETGLPTQKILPFSVVPVDPADVNVSEDGSVPTTFTFESPVYLQGEARYAVVLISASENYNAWISRMGEVDISTVGLPDNQQVIISQQPSLGSLFKSQNGVTWDPSQFEDLKFTIRKAVFNTNAGVSRFYSPELSEGNDQIITLPENSIQTLSRKAVVGLGTTIGGDTSPVVAGLVPGVKISQFGNLNASATLTDITGIATVMDTSGNGHNDITIINPGAGYEPSDDTKTYSDIPMITLTGEGTGIVGNVTVVNGEIGVVTFSNGGKNYAVGDTLGIGTLGTGNASSGSGAVLSVGLVTSFNSITIDNIQGSFNTGIGTIGFNNGSQILGLDGTTGEGAAGGANVGSAVTISTFDVDQNSGGLHFKVDHRAHGLHSFNNLVKIDGVASDVPSTKLTADYANNSLSDIPVVSSSNFATFEGVGVGTTNFGYAILGNEIISYTGVADGSITGITTRGIDNSFKSSHSSGEEIKKYEFSGVSLRRINKTHDMNSPSATVSNPKDLDFYHIKVDMNSDGEDRDGGSLPNRFFTNTKRGGGSKVTASQNVQFETLTPIVQTITPNGTAIGSRIRTTSATSIDGSETSFVDQGFQSISIDDQNHFETPRMIASKINEDRQLSDLPGNKSLTFETIMVTNDANVSPVIDLDRVAMVLTSNRLNDPVSNFASDSRVNKTGQDPVASSYVSKLVRLDNPATSLTVQFASYRRNQSDIRVLFKTIAEGSTENSIDKDFELFPGFDNINQFGNIINESNNNGKPDDRVTPSIGLEFKDYTFSIDDLPPFTKFQIKIDMVGTNQAQPPLIKELRAIALA